MDGNKDDALKCLRIGKEALEAGDRTRALKFVMKARRLDPTLPIDELLSAIDKDAGDQPPAAASAGPSEQSKPPSGQPSIRRRGPVAGASAAASSSSSSSSVTYTEEQISIIREIKRKKNYYEILGLEKNCTVEDVRKSYRKLSLKVHPDKNKAPGSEEAFKAVSKAFQCLSNEESRKKYDLSGEDESVYERRAAARPATRAYNGYYEADIDAEEIFRNFFFGGMAPATNFGGFSFGPGMGHRQAEHGSAGGFNVRALIQLLPVLLILLLNFLPSSDPIYTLSQSYPFEHRFTTPKGVNYYVKSTNFAQNYPPGSRERSTVEEKVEREYFSILRQNCHFELQRRQWGYVRETPHCDMLQKFDLVN
ncbi:chaperone protein dnaJ 49-like [Gastrolobium bilobum]|uniref:chaperone protein dnaJ 49-like n=1 Tax=Gastrolobium bilobum TaxID=150636 RepID=UPI002AB00617|nr:chaperone protein dnaJ 49-like [Gastrolobium bilobum]XP_061363238.1 chaperone protein dnaJ 49-like [Gastrolobium bilobum]